MIAPPEHTVLHKYSRILLCLLLVVFFQRAAAQDIVDTNAVTVENADTTYPSAVTDSEEQKVEIPDTPALRQVPDSVAARLKQDKTFEYANDEAYWTKKKKADREYRKGFWDYFYEFFENTTVRNIAYIVIGILFLFVIYRVVIQNNLFLFYFSKKSKKYDDEEGAIEEVTDIDEAIRKAIDAKNHRLAVRYLYIKLLQRLNDKGLIRYNTKATNHEYMLQMSGNRLSKEFSFLTEVYDYVWYGEFALTDEQFKLVHSNFSNFFQAV